MKRSIQTILSTVALLLLVSSLSNGQPLFKGNSEPQTLMQMKGEELLFEDLENKMVRFDINTREETHPEARVDQEVKLAEMPGYNGDFKNGNPEWEFQSRAFSNLESFEVEQPEVFPFCMNVKLIITWNDSTQGDCSGVLVDSRHVLTAGHCLYSSDYGWAQAIEVVPAYGKNENNVEIKPYGSANAEILYTYPDSIILHNPQGHRHWDAGWIFLDRPVGAITGWFGYGYQDLEQSSFYVGNTFHNSSYPGNPFTGYSMYHRSGNFDHHGYAWQSVNGDFWLKKDSLTHGNDSAGGQSGSGYYNINAFGNRIIYAVLSGSDPGYDPGMGNTLVARLNNQHFFDLSTDIAGDIPPQLDLIPLWTQVSNETVVAGNMLENFSFKVHNYSQPTFNGQTTTKVFLSADEAITEDDLQLGQITGSLFLGERQTTTVTLSGDQPEIPDDISPGEYYLGVALQLSDGDIANNTTGKWDVKKIQVQNIIASPSHLEAQAVGDTLSFDITGNAYWFISEDAPWITLSQLNGTGNATIQVYCTPNPDASSREYELLVVGPNGLIRSVTVFQAGVDLDVSPTALVSEVCGDMVKFQVYSNFPWTVEAIGITWIDILPYGGQQGEWVLLQCDPNGGDQARQAIIHVIAGQVVKEIVVTQSGAELTLNPSSLLFSPEGGEEALEVYSNTCWQLETDADWIFINQMSGEGYAVLQISCALNCGLTQEGIITLTAEGGEISQSFLVTQLGAPLAVSPQLIQMPAIGGSQIIEITANLGWVATPADNWISLEPDSAPGGSQLILTCLPNLLATPRTTYVVVATDCSMELITIHQSGQSSFLFAEPDTIYFSPGIDTQFVLISSNAEWVVTGKPDWVDVSPSGSFGYDTLKVISQVNPGLLARFDTIELSAGGLQEYIFVFQESEFDEVITNEPLYTPTDGSELENELPDGKSEYSDGFESGRKWKISIAGPRNPEATLTLFPNPFEELVTIVIELEGPQSLSLDIQDLAGRRIALLAEGDYPKGKHEIIWSPQGLSKGVFICNLVTGEQILSRLIVKTQ